MTKKCESPIERILLRAMQDYGLLPICQYEIGRYRVDFCFYDERLIVEADGKRWHSSPRAKRRDRLRDKFLRSRGWRVLHITGPEILTDAYECARKIRKELGRDSRRNPLL